MRVLVMGGTRFFGRDLVENLLSDGHQVTIISRGHQLLDFNRPVEHLVADRTDIRSMGARLGCREFEVVFDQICYDPFQAQDSIELFSKRIGHYVLTSTMSVYDYGTSPFSEQAFDAVTHERTLGTMAELGYAEAKRQCEACFYQRADFPVTSIRAPLVMGPRDSSKRLLWHVERIRHGKPIYLPAPHARLAIILSAEIGRLMASLVARPGLGPINLQSEAYVLRELLTDIETICGKQTVFCAESEENHSPYGIADDFYADVHKAESLGLIAAPAKKWIRELIEFTYGQVERDADYRDVRYC